MGVIKRRYFVSHARDEWKDEYVYSISRPYTLGDNYELRGVHKRFEKVQASGVIIVLLWQFYFAVWSKIIKTRLIKQLKWLASKTGRRPLCTANDQHS